MESPRDMSHRKCYTPRLDPAARRHSPKPHDNPSIMVRLRFKRMGRTHRPYYRLNAVDQRTKRDGKSIEQLGHYDPLAPDEAKQFDCNEERVRYWLNVGAQPSETVAALLKKNGITAAPAESA